MKMGNFIDASSDKIIGITENEMKVEYEKDYVLIYKKSLNKTTYNTVYNSLLALAYLRKSSLVIYSVCIC